MRTPATGGALGTLEFEGQTVVCDDGQVLWRLPRPWRDGTTHVKFDPCDFLGRLAVLVPRPRVNLLFYHGVLGARSAWRRAVVPGRGAGEATAAAIEPPLDAAPTPRRRQWADLMRRSFGFDVLACDRCGGRLRLIASSIKRTSLPAY